jgi:transmembrane sensor
MTDHLPEPTDTTLARYLSGECDLAEAEAVRRWVEADPERQRRVEALRELWLQAGRPPVQWDTEAMWAGVSVQMDQPPAPGPLRVIAATDSRAHLRQRKWFARHHSSWWAVAASLLLVAGSAGTVLWWADRTPVPASVPRPMREIATTKGQRVDFRLKDGTHVILSAASRLRVPADYGAQSRNVYLDGEAYFDVVHDSTRRFVVHTRAANTEDLGTRFGVRAYDADTAARVVVAEGRVAVRLPRGGGPETKAWLLGGNQAAEITADGSVAVRERVDAGRLLAWTEGRLVFDDTPLQDAVTVLERWYGLNVQLAGPSIGQRRFTATFREESAPEAVRLIARSLELRVERHGTSVVFSDAATHRPAP